MSQTDTYTVVVGKTPTTLVATTPPPPSAVPGESISFIAQLKALGTPLAGKTVTMYVDGDTVGVVTASDGTANFGITFIGPGTFTIYAEFAGDADYEGCDADVENPFV